MQHYSGFGLFKHSLESPRELAARLAQPYAKEEV